MKRYAENMINPDIVIVGAGLTGSVMAEQITRHTDKTVFIIEQRGHLGGNCHDHTNEHGVRVHDYGPHVVHTNDEEVWEYLSQFTDWYDCKVKFHANVDNIFIPIPFNLNSLKLTHSTKDAMFLESDLIEEYGYGTTITLFELQENPKFNELSDYIYKNIFEGYNQKQWNLRPEELDPRVIGRLPIRIFHNNHYFLDKYQGVPKDGYNAMFERMLSNPQIDILLNTDYHHILTNKDNTIYFNGAPFHGHVIFTGMIDEWFNHTYGHLSYRATEFRYQTIHGVPYIHPVACTTYPNDYDFTRCTEFKHLTGQECKDTTVCFEYPHPYHYHAGLVPCYPIPTKENRDMLEDYERLAEQEEQVTFMGRLGTYGYLNMDECVRQALDKVGDFL